MLYYILSAVPVVALSWFLFIDGPAIVHNSVSDSYTGWKRLNELVSTQEKSVIRTAGISASMIAETLWTSALNYLNSTVKQVNKNTIEVSYVCNGRLYKMVVTPQRGPNPIVKITDENGLDVTARILPYLGPRRDWHHSHLTPHFFGCKELTFEFLVGHVKTFDENERIHIAV